VATGLPNIPYFRIIQNWEERRARRRHTMVRVIRVDVNGGAAASRRALLWRLRQELRTSDLIASEGRDTFHILLTSPDAENAATIAERVEHLGETVSELVTEPAQPLTIRTAIEPAAPGVTTNDPDESDDDQGAHRAPSDDDGA
jgi:hypothetical protein